MQRTVVVPLIRPEQDPDRASEAALPVAQAIAERLDADVVLISVLDLPSEATGDGGQKLLHPADALPLNQRLVPLKLQTERMVAGVGDYLREVAGHFPGRNVETIVRFGSAGLEILKIAGRYPAPLVVMSSHARRGLQRAVVGSVAFQVVSESDGPVIIVPANATDEEFALDRIVVPLDGSLLAEFALDAGLELLGNDGLQLHLVHVIDPLLAGEANLALVREEARRYLDGVAARLREHDIEVEWNIQVGAPVSEITDVATQAGAGLILVGTHGRTGFRRLVLGSVAEGVLHTASLPLLLFRPTDDAIEVSTPIASSTTRPLPE